MHLSGVVNKSKSEVFNSLNNYLKTKSGGIESADINSNHNNFCSINEQNGNTTIFYPGGFLGWDECSEFISRELNTPVFSFHIHDGDLWMYVLFVNGTIEDQFLPLPDYWDENISDEEIATWKGNAKILAKHIPGLREERIEKYLVRWDWDREEGVKAYEDDEFDQSDWQLVDFMKNMGFAYPIDDDGNAIGEVFMLWTNELPLKRQVNITEPIVLNKKPWWKFW